MADFKLSLQERVTLLMMRGWGDRVRSYEEVRVLFNQTCRDGEDLNPISKSTVERTIRRFRDHGIVNDVPKCGRPKSVMTEQKSLDLAQDFVENPHLSLRTAAAVHDVSHEAVRTMLKSIKFHPYKIHLVQELNEDDPDRRLEFCETMMTKIDADPMFLYRIVFSDESTFTLKGEVNRHNCRYWSDTNPSWMMDSHTQYPQKVNVWAGILKDQLIGPFLIDGNLNATKYEDLLRNQIIPRIREIAGDSFDEIWFQQDGAPPHYGTDVRAFLNTQFPRRWIGRRGEIEWPARSPDLTPLDYYLWGHLKSKVYETQPRTLDELRNRIQQAANSIDKETIHRAVTHFYNRLAFCQEAQGLQFEQLC